jgi:hypothetical protein
MSALTFVEPDEPPLSASEPEPAPAPNPNILTCQTCGRDITHLYKGQGAKPRYCEDHRGRQSKPAASTSRMSKDERLRQDLTTMLGTVGFALVMVEPYDGLVVIDRAPATVDALMAVAADNPKVRKVLEQMVSVSVWGQVSMAVAGLALPIAAHHGILPLPVDALERQFLSEATRQQIANLPPRGRRGRAAGPSRPTAVPDPVDVQDVPRDAFGHPL